MFDREKEFAAARSTTESPAPWPVRRVLRLALGAVVALGSCEVLTTVWRTGRG